MGSYLRLIDFLSLNSRLESNKEEEEEWKGARRSLRVCLPKSLRKCCTITSITQLCGQFRRQIFLDCWCHEMYSILRSPDPHAEAHAGIAGEHRGAPGAFPAFAYENLLGVQQPEKALREGARGRSGVMALDV